MVGLRFALFYFINTLDTCNIWIHTRTTAVATCSRWFLVRGFFYLENGGDTFLRKSVHARSTRHHIPEDDILYSHLRENLKSYTIYNILHQTFIIRDLMRTLQAIIRTCKSQFVVPKPKCRVITFCKSPKLFILFRFFSVFPRLVAFANNSLCAHVIRWKHAFRP
jgi:hypothetical protein